MKAPYLLKKELMQLPPQQLADLLHDLAQRCPAVQEAMVIAVAKRPIQMAISVALHTVNKRSWHETTSPYD